MEATFNLSGYIIGALAAKIRLQLIFDVGRVGGVRCGERGCQANGFDSDSMRPTDERVVMVLLLAALLLVSRQ